jgi:hypothetical protein
MIAREKGLVSLWDYMSKRIKDLESQLVEKKKEIEDLKNRLKELNDLKPTGIPTALCPKCGYYSFKVFKNDKNNEHQCCRCQLIFESQLSNKMTRERVVEIINLHAKSIYVGALQETYLMIENNGKLADALMAEWEEEK